MHASGHHADPTRMLGLTLQAALVGRVQGVYRRPLLQLDVAVLNVVWHGMVVAGL